ncbi:MAG: type I-B CRISPR-associated protein Cas8b1/Cst1 [Planctomycetota bacterium]|nr:MAG: type I-B CRISPR-associated protein Cas8b1/Cst1 [Planctomycetota bacterium]
MMNDYEDLKETVEPEVFALWEEVDVEIYAFTELGIKVSINDEYAGLVYNTQIYNDYQEGQKLKGYIKFVREDGKIDVSFQPNQVKNVHITAEKIMKHLEEVGGESKFNDKSSPEDIKNEFQVSKKIFKQAIGHLYKYGKIKITENGIEFVE